MSDEEQDGQETGESDEDGGLGLEELDNDMAAAMATEEDDGDDDGEQESAAKTATDLEAVFDIPVNVSAVLGRALRSSQ